jgi:hypothetical protein
VNLRPFITRKLISLVSHFRYHLLPNSYEMTRCVFSSKNRTENDEDKNKKSNEEI